MSVTRCEYEIDWLAERDNSIGASEVAAVLSLCPFATPLQLWLRKSGLAPAAEYNEAMGWGHRLEEAVAAAFTDATGIKVRNAGDYTIYRNRRTPYLHATPDRMNRDSVLEIKTVGQWMAHHWRDADGCDCVPAYVQAQLQATLHSTGRRVGHVATLIAGQRFLHFDNIPRDEAFIALMVDRCAEFWGRVVNQLPPEACAGDCNAVAELYAEGGDDETAKALGWQGALYAAEWDEADEWVKRWTDQRDAAKANLQLAIGEADRGVLPDGSSFSWKRNTKGTRIFRRTRNHGTVGKI